jgi:endonuclease-3 related protein
MAKDQAALQRFRQFRELLHAAYGPQQWWPADDPFEVMLGAILTQNTAWSNVQRAIENLKQANILSLHGINACPPQSLAELIRPSGYFNIKTRRLQNLCRFILENGGLETLADWPSESLRAKLLGVNGVGPETADDILLYAFNRPVFVVDAYTRRIGERFGLLQGGEAYEQIRHDFESALGADAVVFNELHAQIVRHAKDACRKKSPLCENCCLRTQCAYARGHR